MNRRLHRGGRNPDSLLPTGIDLFSPHRTAYYGTSMNKRNRRDINGRMWELNTGNVVYIEEPGFPGALEKFREMLKQDSRGADHMDTAQVFRTGRHVSAHAGDGVGPFRR